MRDAESGAASGTGSMRYPENGMSQEEIDELSMRIEEFLDSDGDVDYEGVLRSVFSELNDSEYGRMNGLNELEGEA